MYLHEELLVSLVKQRQVEIREEFDRYRLMRAACTGRPPARRRLRALFQRVWRRVDGTQTMLIQQPLRADYGKERSCS